MTINCFHFNEMRETNTGGPWKLSLASILGSSADSFLECCCQNPSDTKLFRDQLCKPWPRRLLPLPPAGDQIKSRGLEIVFTNCSERTVVQPPPPWPGLSLLVHSSCWGQVCFQLLRRAQKAAFLQLSK